MGGVLLSAASAWTPPRQPPADDSRRVASLRHRARSQGTGPRGLLDPEALRLAGVPDRETLDRLDALNTKIAAARSVDRRIDLDDRWHLELVAGCGNPLLLDLITDFMGRTRRYELAYLRERRHVATATDEHLVVTRALRERNLDAACEALRRNLTSGVEPIRAWLEERTNK